MRHVYPRVRSILNPIQVQFRNKDREYCVDVNTFLCMSTIQGFLAQEYVSQNASSSRIIARDKCRSVRVSSTTHSSFVVQLISSDVRLARSVIYCCNLPSKFGSAGSTHVSINCKRVLPAVLGFLASCYSGSPVLRCAAESQCLSCQCIKRQCNRAMFQQANVSIINNIEEASMPRKMVDWTSPQLKCNQTLARAIQSDPGTANRERTDCLFTG